MLASLLQDAASLQLAAIVAFFQVTLRLGDDDGRIFANKQAKKAEKLEDTVCPKQSKVLSAVLSSGSCP